MPSICCPTQNTIRNTKLASLGCKILASRGRSPPAIAPQAPARRRRLQQPSFASFATLRTTGSPAQSRSGAGIACPEGRQLQERRGGPWFPAEKRRRLLHLPTDANPSNAADEKAGRDPHDPRTVTCKSLRTVTPKTPAGLPHGPHGGPQPRGDVSIGCGPKLVTSSCSSAPTLRLCLRACVHPRRSARRVCMCAHELARPGVRAQEHPCAPAYACLCAYQTD